ncbi:MAG TPA: hypothetical protein VN943_19095 [Candidatus Acidoferrum sp.]|nr:hypothetical protein [Candidatus Acidoferrum sp.]
MNRNICACSLVGGALLLAAGMLSAQDPPPPAFEYHAEGPDGGGPAGPFAERIELLGFEGLHPGKVVKGAPFSATANSDTTQTLQDGTTIHRTTSSTLYRDGQGRVRREVSLSGFGPLQASGKPHTMITIGDPVAGAHYLLDPEQKLAHKMTPHKGGKHGELSNEKAHSFEQKMQQRMAKEEASSEVKKESLGTQAINGVNAEGTRITRTIPAGQIGNDKPIQILFERWYSPDLQIVVKSTRTDPRFGTTTYTLTNVQRAEPAAALFTVPSDYTVKEGGPGGPGIHHHGFHGAPAAGAPADVPPPPPGA